MDCSFGLGYWLFSTCNFGVIDVGIFILCLVRFIGVSFLCLFFSLCSFLNLFILWMCCFGIMSLWYCLLVIQPPNMLLLLFMRYLFGVWCIFDLFFGLLFCLLIFEMQCFGSSLFLYCLLVIRHGNLSCHCFGGFHLVFGEFSILLCCIFVGNWSVCSLFGCIVLVLHPFCEM